jgi:Protein of unknown function (DUF3175)
MARKASRRKWSQDVTEHSDARGLDPEIFTLKDPKKIAASQKKTLESAKDELRAQLGR